MKKAIFSLVLLIFIAGCISGNKTPVSSDGLVINEFSADPIQSEASDRVRFFLDVENIGGTDARCVTSELFGVDSWRDDQGIYFSSLFPGAMYTPSRGLFFNYNNGNFNACYSDYTKPQDGGVYGSVCVNRVQGQGVSLSSFIGSAFQTFNSQFCTALSGYDPKLKLLRTQSILEAPQPSLGKPGQSQTFEWVLMPPVLPEGATATYPITSRTSYFYSTNAVMNVQAFNKAEVERRKNTGKPLTFPLVVENSFNSPIQVFVERGSSPIIVNPDMTFTPEEVESYRFEFANLGQGYPLPMAGADIPNSYAPETQNGFIAAIISVNGPGVYFKDDCFGQTVSGQPTEILLSPASIAGLVKLRADQRVPLGCTIGIDKRQWVTNEIGTVSFTFSLWYRYFVDRTIPVKVIGVQGLTGQQVASAQGRI